MGDSSRAAKAQAWMQRPKRKAVFRFADCFLPHTGPTVRGVSQHTTFSTAFVSRVRSPGGDVVSGVERRLTP